MVTHFTIYQLQLGDNIKALAVTEDRETAETITKAMLNSGADVWYEPDQYERDYKRMNMKLPATLEWQSGAFQ